MIRKLAKTVRAVVPALLLTAVTLVATTTVASAAAPAAQIRPAVLSGFVELENDRWGGCVNAPGGALNVTLQLDRCIGAPTELWLFRPTTPGGHVGSLLNRASNLCMEVNNGDANPGERVDEWTCLSGDTAELWVDYLINGQYHFLQHYGTNQCLDTVGSAGSQLMQYTCTPSGPPNPQYWIQI